MALQEWIQDGPLTGVAEYEKVPKSNLGDVPEHERSSCCDGSPLERAIRSIVEGVRTHESDNDLLEMYNKAKKAANHTFTTKSTLNELMKSLKSVLKSNFNYMKAAACLIFQYSNKS